MPQASYPMPSSFRSRAPATGNDVLTGNNGNDRLDGGAGNDRLDGRAGADTMIGGAGDDTYVVDDPRDAVQESANGGVDTIESSISYTLRAHVENLDLIGSGAVNGTGNELDNRMLGNDAFNVLVGGAGNDWLDGRGGRDQLVGGSGDDYYVVDHVRDTVVERAGEGTDHVESTVSFRLGANVENLYLAGNAAIQGTGNGLANTLVGNNAANVLQGLAGNDILIGAGGNDRLIGGTGVDQLTGGTGSDTFVFRNGDTGATAATADTIVDFQKGDKLDLTELGTTTGGNLDYVGTAAFSGTAGDLRLRQLDGNTLVEGDLDGDRLVDFVIRLNGAHSLSGDDFLF